MSNDVLDCLVEDHGRFERLFQVIEEHCLRLESGQPTAMPQLRAIATYLSGTASSCHHALEDAIFAQLERRLPRFRADVFDLIDDHRVSRLEVENFIAAANRGNGTLIDKARSFIANERGHFISEEEIVFPHAIRHLTEGQWDDLRECLKRLNVDAARTENLELIADLLN